MGKLPNEKIVLLITLPEFAPTDVHIQCQVLQWQTLLRLRTEKKPKADNTDIKRKKKKSLIREIQGHSFLQ